MPAPNSSLHSASPNALQGHASRLSRRVRTVSKDRASKHKCIYPQSNCKDVNSIEAVATRKFLHAKHERHTATSITKPPSFSFAPPSPPSYSIISRDMNRAIASFYDTDDEDPVMWNTEEDEDFSFIARPESDENINRNSVKEPRPLRTDAISRPQREKCYQAAASRQSTAFHEEFDQVGNDEIVPAWNELNTDSSPPPYEKSYFSCASSDSDSTYEIIREKRWMGMDELSLPAYSEPEIDESGPENSDTPRQHRPFSALATKKTPTNDNIRTRPRSAWLHTKSITQRYSTKRGLFFEEKLKEQNAKALLEQEATQKLERAQRGTPPIRMLERQAQSALQREQRIQASHRAFLNLCRQTKARQVPETTYIAPKENESERRERILQRSQYLFQKASAPPRMTLSQKPKNATNVHQTHIKSFVRPVPNFEKLHEKLAAPPHTSTNTSVSRPFFLRRQSEYERLHRKRLARKQRHISKEMQAQNAHETRQKAILRKLLSENCRETKLTKSDRLRKMELEKRAAMQRQMELDKAQAEHERLQKCKRASARVRAQVERLETQRRNEYSGEILDLETIEKEHSTRAKQAQKLFHQALRQNQQRLTEAMEKQPSLMERFAAELQKERHKKKALKDIVSCVMKNKNT